MRTVIIIPARFKSSRFPGKPLASILGRPMVVWVAELSAKAVGAENVYVATDDGRISRAIEEYGFRTVMTSEKALTGTDRIWEAARSIEADVYINVQGDEPLVSPDDILRIVSVKQKFPDEVINGMTPLKPSEDPYDVNIPKVIATEDNRLVYMSRLPVPGAKSSENKPERYWKQVCIYAFNMRELDAFGGFGRKSNLERMEDIEILRFLELGIPIRMVETGGVSYAVDVPEDVEKVEAELKKTLK